MRPALTTCAGGVEGVNCPQDRRNRLSSPAGRAVCGVKRMSVVNIAVEDQRRQPSCYIAAGQLQLHVWDARFCGSVGWELQDKKAKRLFSLAEESAIQWFDSLSRILLW